jgi:hypothetical protein
MSAMDTPAAALAAGLGWAWRASGWAVQIGPDRFGLPAAVSCVFSLCVCCGCWSGLAPRSSSTSVAAWTCQEKLVEVHE